jgi:CheY-like chemotaxis protein
VDELLTAVCWPPAKFIVQKPRTFCRPAGDRVLVETVLFNATQNARLHGGDAPVQVSAAFSCHEEDCDLRLEVINVAGRNHAQLRALRVQDLLAADVDFASLGMGTAESTFLGLRDITLAAKAMEPPASVELRVEEDCVRFVMVCTLKVASDEEPPSRGVKRSRDLPDGLCYVVLDDDKITRLLARKQIAKFGPHPSSIVLGESRQEALSVPERVRTLALELGEENVIVILDQNLNYPDGDVLGTDLASTLRRNAYGGTIVIQSANAEPSDCITYADAGADGTLAKGVLAATSAAELALIFWGRLAKGRKRSRT